MSREASYARKTAETDIAVKVNLYGKGRLVADTGFGFLDHMLAQLAHHSLMDIEVKAFGDLETGYHHLAEDIGICLGRALKQAVVEVGLEGAENESATPIRRFGSFTAPMDGSLSRVALDFSGRGGAFIDAPSMDEDIAEFVKAFAREAGMTLHMDVLKSDNRHHATEGCFKALALSLRAALAPDTERDGSSSSKGCIG